MISYAVTRIFVFDFPFADVCTYPHQHIHLYSAIQPVNMNHDPIDDTHHFKENITIYIHPYDVILRYCCLVKMWPMRAMKNLSVSTNSDSVGGRQSEDELRLGVRLL